jgi:hypothetical protein
MRHLHRVEALLVALLARGVVRSTLLGALVRATGTTKALGPCTAATGLGAVPLTVIAESAEIDDLPAGGPWTND